MTPTCCGGVWQVTFTVVFYLGCTHQAAPTELHPCTCGQGGICVCPCTHSRTPLMVHRYCYNRHFEIYNLSSQAKTGIINICAAARASLPETSRRKLFVHLNLMHASACAQLPASSTAGPLHRPPPPIQRPPVLPPLASPSPPRPACPVLPPAMTGAALSVLGADCALTPIYNFENFLDTFSKLHHIELPDHYTYFHDVDVAGGTHYNTCAVWAMRVLQRSLEQGEMHHETYRSMHDEILRVRSLFAAIFSYQYQVIPFSYSHLVSVTCFLYLLGLAISKVSPRDPNALLLYIARPAPPHSALGASPCAPPPMAVAALAQAVRFTPDADYLEGLVLPGLSFSVALITTVGLIEIGQVRGQRDGAACGGGPSCACVGARARRSWSRLADRATHERAHAQAPAHAHAHAQAHANAHAHAHARARTCTRARSRSRARSRACSRSRTRARACRQFRTHGATTPRISPCRASCMRRRSSLAI